jgi:pimeloyl-ACP methyl ester carboxylesterase/predicted glycosyltransferase
MRALDPDNHGFAVNPLDGVRIFWESWGPRDAEQTVVFLPTWSIVHSRVWKFQVPYFARHGMRVVAFDGRGNGRSDRPQSGYSTDHFTQDTLAVLDMLDIRQAAVVGYSAGGRWAIQLAAEHPERVTHLALIAPAVRLGETPDSLTEFYATPPDREGFHKYTALHWREDYPDFVNWFFSVLCNEPHSTKQIEDGVGWGLETTAEILIATTDERVTPRLADLAAAVRSPTIVLHGDRDEIISLEVGRAVHRSIAGSRMVVLEGSGHAPHLRDPVVVNNLLLDFVGRPVPAERRWKRAMSRNPRRALFVSSPIGLGHIQRDLAIARELRELIPDLEIHWWTQHPATRVLEDAGETIHPLSRAMSSESAHWEQCATGHELHAFDAFRKMDEIFLANFMLFHDMTRQEPYDVWIGDEAWEIDYYLHENPELKTAPYVFLTDVIGFLPVDPDADPHDAELCADYNAEMIAQRARNPWLRDLSLYIGEYDELPAEPFGPGLPGIREWAREWFEPVGYVVPDLPADYRDRDALRARLGYAESGPLIFAAVGGTAIGRGLLENVARALPLIHQELPEARLVLVTGPRIDPASLPDIDGLEKRPYVHNLFEHLACADAAVVQGGLTTTMELVMARRPFVYVPLRKHWEQERHVAHRLDHYRAGIRLDHDAGPPDVARALLQAMAQPLAYRDVTPGAARRAAERITSVIAPPRAVKGGMPEKRRQPSMTA